jgi:hypothetical protein
MSLLTSAIDIQAEAAQKLTEDMWQQSQDKIAVLQSELEMKQMLVDEELASDETFKMTKMESDLAFFEERMAVMAEQHEIERALLEQGLAAKHATAEQAAAAQKALDDKQFKDWLAMEQQKQKLKKDIDKANIATASNFMGDMSSLMQSGNKELFAIGKAFSVGKAMLDGYTAIQNALATVPYPLNLVASAGIAVKTGMNIAKINSTQLATGIDEVPGIGSMDNFPAMLAPGERVVPTETNKDLKAFLDAANSGGRGQQEVVVRLEMNENIMDMIEAKLIERRRYGTGLGF